MEAEFILGCCVGGMVGAVLMMAICLTIMDKKKGDKK